MAFEHPRKAIPAEPLLLTSSPPPAPETGTLDLRLVEPLVRATAAFARLDQALGTHPLRPALLYRARLDAIRRQAASDGEAIDPWHLAAVLEGLRPRMAGPRIIDRGTIFAAARHALELHQWLVSPGFDEEGEVQAAERALASAALAGATPLLAAADAFHRWLDRGGARAPMRAAVIRFWTRQRLLRASVPLSGNAALRADVPWEPGSWRPLFLHALADEAADTLQLLFDIERGWLAARRAVTGRRRNSRAAAAVDILAAAPVVSAATLAAGLGMAANNATDLLDEFCREGIAIDVSHRHKRRLFALAGLAPLRDAVAPPRRPEPGRGRGRPVEREDQPEPVSAPPDPVAVTPLERHAFDYAELEHWTSHADQAIRNARRALDVIAARQANDGG